MSKPSDLAANLLRLVLSRGLRLTAAGVAFGTLAALALTRLLGKLVYQVSPQDPVLFASALVVMTAAAISAWSVACMARAPTDPARVLRD